MPVSIHAIRAATVGNLPFVDVEVEGWGAVRLLRLKPEDRERSLSDIEIVSLAAVDDGGALLFANIGDRLILEENPVALAKLATAARLLNKAAAPVVRGSASVTE